MSFKIVSDSASNILRLPGVAYACVPLKIITDQAEYIDDETLDVAQMVTDLRQYKGRSGTSCPNVQEWLSAFCERKYNSAFSREMSRSVRKYWQDYTETDETD